MRTTTFQSLFTLLFILSFWSSVISQPDMCSTAIEITDISDCFFNSVNTNGYSNSNYTNQCYSANDVWYKFTATQVGLYVSPDASNTSNIRLEFYEDCITQTPIDCMDLCPTCTFNNVQGLTIGDEYYIKVSFITPITQGGFCIEETCGITLSNYTIIPCDNNTNLFDVELEWQLNEMPNTPNLHVSVGSKLEIFALNQNNGIFTHTVTGINSDGLPTNISITNYTGTICFNNYYEHFVAPPPCIPPPVNNTCATATEIQDLTSCQYIPISIAGATLTTPDCDFYGEEIWYKFTPNTSELNLSFNEIPSFFGSVAYTIYSSCGQTFQFCDFVHDGNVRTISNLSPGTEYLMSIQFTRGYQGEMCLFESGPCYAEIDIVNSNCNTIYAEQILNYTPNASLILLENNSPGPFNLLVNGVSFSYVQTPNPESVITYDLSQVGVDINTPGVYSIVLEEISQPNNYCTSNTGNVHNTTIEVVEFPEFSESFTCDQNGDLVYEIFYNGTGGVPLVYFDLQHSLDGFQQHTFQLSDPLPPASTLVYSETIPLECATTDIETRITPNCFQYYFHQNYLSIQCGQTDPCDLDFSLYFVEDESCPGQSNGVINGEVNSSCHQVNIDAYKDGAFFDNYSGSYLYLSGLSPGQYTFVATSNNDQNCTLSFGPIDVLPGPTDDTDGDNIYDCEDNCPFDFNQNQSDMDGDGIGDACDVCPEDYFNDIDGDGICGNLDNCPELSNTDQSIVPCDFTQYATCRERDSMALVAFHTTTLGYQWFNQWDLTQPMDSWAGVILDASGCYVEILFTYQNKLNGYLPNAIGVMDQLIVLDLFDDNIGGEIPSTIGDLTNLEYLNLARQNLTGSIPSSIGSCTSLEHINIWQNQLTGNIPTQIGNLINLVTLSISFNQLSGSIPMELENLTNLEIAFLSNNNLSGSIPEMFTNLQSLRYFEVQNNNLEGALPVGIADIPSLMVYYAWNNNFEGCFPSNYIQNLCNINYSFWNNPLLPFYGDMYAVCSGNANQDVDGDMVCSPQDCDDNDDTVGADTSPPNPICTGNGEVALGQGSGTFPINLDFIATYDPNTQTHAQIDDCTDVYNLGIEISKDGGSYGYEVGLICDDIGKAVDISYKITDNAGNEAFCNFNISVVDGDDTCPCVDELQIDLAGGYAEYEANIKVTSDAIILGDVKMHGGTSVELNQGFEVKPNALFEAYIEGCDNN